MKVWRLFVYLMLSFTPLHCASSLVSQHIDSHQHFLPADYPSYLTAWTQEAQLYDVFDSKITLHATLLTPVLKRAFVARFPDVAGSGAFMTAKELLPKSDDNALWEEVAVFIAAYTPNDRWNDLEQPHSIWHLTLRGVNSLQDSDESAEWRVDAVRIEKVKMDESIRTLFPYVSDFDQAYIARFKLPRSVAEQQLSGKNAFYIRLHLASTLGNVFLTWRALPPL